MGVYHSGPIPQSGRGPTRTSPMQSLWLLLHILSAIVAFGALFSQPLVGRENPGSSASFAKVGTLIQAPALLVLLVSGVLSAIAGPGESIMGQTWVSAGFVVWFAMAVVLYLLINAHRKESASAVPLGGVMHLLLVIGLILMIWKPGAGV